MPIGESVGKFNGVVVLNATAHSVWQLLAQDRSLEELASAVVEQFDVDLERARADVRHLLDEMAGMGLLQQ